MEETQSSNDPSTTKNTNSDHHYSSFSTESDTFKDILTDVEEKRSTGAKWIIGAGAILLLGLGGVWAYNNVQRKDVEPIAVTTELVQRGNVENTITEAGTVELGGQQTFTAPSDVTVEDVLVKERERVSAGTVLIVLRDRQLQRELQDQILQNQIDDNDLKRKREVLQERQSRLQEAKDRLADAQALLQRGFISEDDFRTDKNSYEDALSTVRDAQVALVNAELTNRNNRLKTQSLRTQISDNQIRSPIDAVVLKVEVRAGDGVQQEGRLLTIGDPNQETIRLQLSTLNASKVQRDMKVRVSIIGPNPQVFEGRISRVSPQAVSGESGQQSSGSDPSRVEAEAILNQPSNSKLIPGSSVSVEIIVDQRVNVVTVPLPALQSDADGQSFVWVKDREGRAQRRTVQVGLRSLQSVEIISGLQEKDEIVVGFSSGEDAIAPGSPLTTNTP